MPSDFHRVWGEHEDVDFSAASCAPGLEFAAWAEELCARALAENTQMHLLRAKLYLTDRYFQYRVSVPPAHRGVAGEERADHRCIFQVYADAYWRLHRALLGLDPPPLVPTPSSTPLPPPKGRLDGIMVGEVADDEF